ncbi:MAG: hypothetical protein GX493_11380 [Firmicutes bacterium]|nr:hypothetical protein [Bacillota bacterium]
MNLNQMELQSLRQLIGIEETAGRQLGVFAQQCQDPQLKSLLEEAANRAAQNGRMLMGFLQT